MINGIALSSFIFVGGGRGAIKVKINVSISHWFLEKLPENHEINMICPHVDVILVKFLVAKQMFTLA